MKMKKSKSEALMSAGLGELVATLRSLTDRKVKRHHLRRIRSDDRVADRIAAILLEREPAPQSLSTGIVYSKASMYKMLGLACTEDVPAPAAVPGKVICWCEWTLGQLHKNPVIWRKCLMQQERWYDDRPWAKVGPKPGYYEIEIQVPGSTNMTWKQHEDMGKPVASVHVGVTAALGRAIETWQDFKFDNLMKGHRVRFLEQTSSDRHVEASLFADGFHVSDRSDADARGDLWLASAREVS